MDRLRKRLNSNDQPAAEHNESDLSAPEEPNSPHDWQHDQESGGSGHDILNKFLVFAGIFVLLAAGFAAVVIATDDSGVSPERVDIRVDGPDKISAGETTNFDVTLTNNNEKTLRDVSLNVEFPPGTRQPDNSGGELRRSKQHLGDIDPNETVSAETSASLFGRQSQTQQITMSAEYSVADSNAIFSADKSFTVTIGELPVAVNISAPNQTAPGQPVTFDISVQSNSTKTLNNVILRGEYPFGFTTIQTSPEPAYQDNVWSLGDIEPGEKQEISVTGRFGGSVSSGQRTVRFASGIASEGSDVEVGTLFAERSQTLSLQAPLLGLSLDIGEENNSQLTLNGGSGVSGVIAYQNNVNQPLRATEITLNINGDSVNSGTVTADQGLYRKSDQQITWNGQTADKLKTIAPGESGELSFGLETKGAKTLAAVKNPTVEFNLRGTAQPPSGTDLPSPITAELTRTSKVLSDVNVTTKSLRDSDRFAVSGPYPPEVDTETGYVLGVSVANTSNQLTDARLRADVPAYVSVVGDPQLSAGSFTYNETIGRLRWEIDELPAGAGYSRPKAVMYLPVTIEPTLDQEGSSPDILTGITLTAVDSFVEKAIQLEGIDEPNTQAADIDDDSRGSVTQ
jgi:hypothetical protein